jgi:hypothetical protein
MAKHNVQTAPVGDPAVTSTTTGPTAVAPMSGSEGASATTTRKRGGVAGRPKGPALVWSDVSGANPSPRDIALVQTIRANPGAHAETIAVALQTHDAFKGELSPVTAGKVRQRVKELQKQGVSLPSFPRGGGGGKKRYAVDANSLNSLLQ